MMNLTSKKLRNWTLAMAGLWGSMTTAASAQSFFDINRIQKIEIFFSFTNWDYRLDTATVGGDSYTIADSVRINGVKLDSVGVKYKGNSSYNANRAKNPLHLEFDHIKDGQDYMGLSDAKLGNLYSDPTMVREALAYDILSQYMHCSRANFAQVYVNGSLIGLYSNAEAINKDFLAEHFYSTDNTLVKCNPVSGAGPGSSGYPSLEYLGTSSTSYSSRYEIKSDSGWNDLINLCNILNNTPANIETILDVDKALWMLAFNNVSVNLDSYTGAFAQNYYLYMDDNARFNSIVWDLNMCFGGFSMGIGNTQMNTTAMQNLSPTYGSTYSSRPLIQKLLANSTFLKMYIAHMRTINNENFVNGTYRTKAQAMMAIIDTAVQSDPNKFYTYTQFQNSLTTAASGGTGGGMNAPALVTLMGTRASYLAGTTELSQTPPTISSVQASPAAPAYNSTVTILATVTNTTASEVYVGYRYALTDKFTRVLMYDDGAHNDGAAGDNVYGAAIQVLSGQMQYYIYAQNTNAGMFSPERAEYEFYTLNTAAANISVGDLVINEFEAINTAGETDPSGSFSDWIELYNNTSNPIDLTTVYLSDNISNPFKWAFPSGTTINGNGYLIVWADEDTTQADIHCNFKLSGSGEELILSLSDGTVLDSLTFGAQTANVTYGRYPNGTGAFTTLTPTFNANNTITAVASVSDTKPLALYPNPTNSILNIEGDHLVRYIEVYNMLGQLVQTYQTTTNNIDVAHLQTGTYVIRLIDEQNITYTAKFQKF